MVVVHGIVRMVVVHGIVIVVVHGIVRMVVVPTKEFAAAASA